MIVPVARKHVGWVTFAVGAVATGCAFTTTLVASLVQPAALFTVTL